MTLRYIITPADMPQDTALIQAFPWLGHMPYSFIPVSGTAGNKYNLSLLESVAVGEVREWCRDQFGPSCNRMEPGGRWFEAQFDFFFRDVAAATAFRLRWT